MYTLSEGGRRLKTRQATEDRPRKLQSIYWSMQNICEEWRYTLSRPSKSNQKKTSDNLHKEDFCWYSQPFRKDMQTNSDQKQVMHQMATAALKQNHQICAFLLKQYAYPDMKPSSLTNILACFVKWTYRTNLYIVYVKHQKLKHWKMHFLNVQHLLNYIKYVQATLSMLFFPWKWTFTH